MEGGRWIVKRIGSKHHVEGGTDKLILQCTMRCFIL
jgi:hypothetical protein